MNIYYNESKNVWVWKAQGEQGEAQDFYEARLMSLRSKIWGAIHGSYKIHFDAKEDAYQQAMEALLVQMREDPAMAENTDSWIIYRAFGYGYRHVRSFACCYMSLEGGVSLDRPNGEKSSEEGTNQKFAAIDFPIEELEAEADAAALLAHLAPKLRFVAERLMQGHMKKEIAEMMGVSATMITKYISQLRQDERLKEAWATI